MAYVKPEIAVLGNAACLILGSSKHSGSESQQPTNEQVPPDCEFDD